MTEIPLTPFYFLRHGQTDWNLVHKVIGSQDVLLNDRGVCQAQSAGKLLKNQSIRTIISSPLLRAWQTAVIITRYVKAPLIEIAELREACWGEKEGEPKGDGLWIEAWRNGQEIKNAEKYTDFAARAKQGIQKALNYTGPVLIVSHGGVYGALQEMLGLPSGYLSHCVPLFYKPPAYPNTPWMSSPLSEGGCRLL